MKIAGPIVLAILDGWGIAPPSRGNAVTLARTPNLDHWRQTYPWTTLKASGRAVGLPDGQDGNSEAGHMNIGAGRIVPQEDMQILSSISNGLFFRNSAFLAAIQHVKSHGRTLHLMGMLGTSESAHADPDHLLALLMLVQNAGLTKVKLHLFTDGRDSPRFAARDIITKFLPHLGDARVATLMGRFFSMDRNKNWDRTAQAYRAIVSGQATHRVPDVMTAVSQAYNRGESDEFVQPTVIAEYQGVADGDAIIFFNLRSDRARQLTKAFVQPDFEQRNAATHPFRRTRVIDDLLFVAMTDFGPDLGNILTAFPAQLLTQTLPMVLQRHHQLYIAESEKYAHVTYFFNGGYADPVGGEDRVMIPSSEEPFYDRVPTMCSRLLTNRVYQTIISHEHDFVVVNFANTDMVAHTGNLRAGVAAMECADGCLGRIAEAVLGQQGGLLITGDHGNLEEMINLATGEIDTEHSAHPVPFHLVAEAAKKTSLRADGVLGDVAPTILALMGERQPAEMTGTSLLGSHR
ncbi:MAG: 2,3-bisphosphoglycerate-independent phosphoglycerate mutase [Candidatus Kerfeldbacteria bacterium]|nr:2,3-bisphosphoglycerate-independent phosphoglycerate mutase [Candidatus Kerfeldbacteria bacterium]